MYQLEPFDIKSVMHLGAIHRHRDEVDGIGIISYRVRMRTTNIIDDKIIKGLQIIIQTPKPLPIDGRIQSNMVIIIITIQILSNITTVSMLLTLSSVFFEHTNP